MPIIIKVDSDNEVELAEKIDVKEILVQNNSSDEPVCGAYIKCNLGLVKDTFIISKNNPHFFMLDIFRYDQDCELTPGKYEVSVKIIVYIVDKSGGFEELVLDGKRSIEIVQ
jgi:hypothetical protein